MTRLRILFLAGLGLTFGLGSCVTAPEPPPPPAAAKPAPTKVVKKKPAKKPATKPAGKESEPPPAPAVAPDAEAEAEAAVAVPVEMPQAWPPPLPPPVVTPAVVAAPPPPPEPPRPLNVVGKSDHEVVALLGQPAREHVASAVKVMRFTADGCAVEVHFFPDVKHGSYRALEMTAAGPVAPPDCLGKVRAGRG